MSKNSSHKFLDLRDSVAPDAALLKEAAARVIDSGRFLNGPETQAFEKELAESCGAGACVGVSNGLDALRLIFRALIETGRLKQGDEVIYPANTYIASVLPLSEFGLIPVGVEPSEEDFNIDFSRLEEKVTPRTKAVLLVHLYGNPCWDTAVCSRLRDRGIIIVEDNAQAIGALAAGEGFHATRATGALGDAAAFSFYPTKNIGALGDAGAVTTSDPELAAAVRALANYGCDRRYHNIYRGYNCRLDEIQAAFLRVRLRCLDEIIHGRGETARAYGKSISNPLVTTPRIFEDRLQVWHQYPLLSPRRDELKEFLASEGVQTDIHYAVPPHLQPCYAGGRAQVQSFPLTERLASQILSIPIANTSPAEAREIAEIINSFR